MQKLKRNRAGEVTVDRRSHCRQKKSPSTNCLPDPNRRRLYNYLPDFNPSPLTSFFHRQNRSASPPLVIVFSFTSHRPLLHQPSSSPPSIIVLSASHRPLLHQSLSFLLTSLKKLLTFFSQPIEPIGELVQPIEPDSVAKMGQPPGQIQKQCSNPSYIFF
ncbi:hypothetical protein SLEP1_g24448 [Rubroshorea leprosula]|uniref:Uncharacterized protein n=1 Tax=Rubroshorea leprosula TaxID=152421 RepID=A0AAV5JN25_9ROSI|nr:hypothetical protein SLEP1_g24448 [Rubroshorea leprosula]